MTDIRENYLVHLSLAHDETALAFLNSQDISPNLATLQHFLQVWAEQVNPYHPHAGMNSHFQAAFEQLVQLKKTKLLTQVALMQTAMRYGNFYVMQMMVDEGYDLYQTHPHTGELPAYNAFAANQLRLFEFFLKNGFDPGKYQHRDFTQFFVRALQHRITFLNEYNLNFLLELADSLEAKKFLHALDIYPDFTIGCTLRIYRAIVNDYPFARSQYPVISRFFYQYHPALAVISLLAVIVTTIRVYKYRPTMADVYELLPALKIFAKYSLIQNSLPPILDRKSKKEKAKEKEREREKNSCDPLVKTIINRQVLKKAETVRSTRLPLHTKLFHSAQSLLASFKPNILEASKPLSQIELDEIQAALHQDKEKGKNKETLNGAETIKFIPGKKQKISLQGGTIPAPFSVTKPVKPKPQYFASIRSITRTGYLAAPLRDISPTRANTEPLTELAQYKTIAPLVSQQHFRPTSHSYCFLNINELPPQASAVFDALAANGAFTCFVGGRLRAAIRRVITGLEDQFDTSDLDVVTNLNVGQLHANKYGWGALKMQNQLLQFTLDHQEIDIFQSEVFKKAGITLTPDEAMREDALTRGFTMDMLFAEKVCGHWRVMDPTGRAFKDITHRIIDTYLPPDEVLEKDPIFILRAMYFSVTKNFTISDRLLTAIENKKALILALHPQRLKAYIHKIESATLSKDIWAKLIALGIAPLIRDNFDKNQSALPDKNAHQKDFTGHYMLKKIDDLNTLATTSSCLRSMH